MADDANFVRDTNDAGDDPVHELFTTCDRLPLEGLAWIDRLDVVYLPNLGSTI